MLKPERKRRGDNLWIEPVDWSRGLSANCGQWCGIPSGGRRLARLDHRDITSAD